MQDDGDQVQSESQGQIIIAAKRREKTSAAQTQRRVNAEANGKFKAEEIALVLDGNCSILKEINKKFDGKLEAGTRLAVLFMRCSIGGLYRWTHRAISKGGSTSVGQPNSEVFPYCVLEMAPDDFVAMVKQTRDGIEFDIFVEWVGDTLRRMRSQEKCPVGTRLTVLIVGLDRYLSKQPPRSEISSSCRLPITQLIDNAMAFLLLSEYSVELVSVKSASEAADYLHGVTRCLMAEPYRRLEQDLDCADKFSKKLKSVEGASDAAVEEHLKQITWINTLRSVNGVSETIANRIASLFKTPKELIEALNDPMVPLTERQNFLQEKLGNGTGKHKYSKLSRKIFRVFTSLDEHQKVNSDDELEDENCL